jgi:hypothetical protein
MKELTQAQAFAIIAAILDVTGAKNLAELAEKEPTKEQWREAYKRAGVPYLDIWKR